MANNGKSKTPEYFRDKLTTVKDDGSRAWIYAKKVKGRYFNRRKIVAVFLLALFYIGPFIKIGNEPIMLFDIMQRKFVLFGVVFWPQDFHLILISFITIIVFVVLFTVIFGRLFCGWICPQTIFMEFVFRQVEYLIEGTAANQRKLDKQPMNFEKAWKKSLKHLIFFIISIITAATFLAYMVGKDEVLRFLSENPFANVSGWSGLLIFSGLFYFVFAFFREQVCTIACPYGRLQGVLVDSKSIIVGYDYKRGEPRGPITKNGISTDNGDCINCNACVVVCPTGIDIRNGTQLECINCTACIDACDAVMDRIDKPKGLIRYDSEDGIETGNHSIINIRSIAYSIVLTLLLVFVGYLFMLRGDFESTILRARGSLYQVYGADSLSNIYNYNLVNKSNSSIKIDYILESPTGRIKHIQENLAVEIGEIGRGTFLIVINKDELSASNIPVIIGLYKDGEKLSTYSSTFVGPSSLNKK
ncbi:MAG: cytochrome c oxidase accessory protein CcoG [Bacteroidota bacterium]